MPKSTKMQKSKETKTMKTHINNKSNSQFTDNCITNYCGKEFPKKQKKIEQIFIKTLKTKKMTPIQKQIYKELIKKKQDESKNKDLIALQNKMCISTYCNPKCKNTIFESGDKIPIDVYKNAKALLDINLKDNPKEIPKAYKLTKKGLKHMREFIFDKNTNVLKDNFYQKLEPKIVKQLKKEGAISGCSIFSL